MAHRLPAAALAAALTLVAAASPSDGAPPPSPKPAAAKGLAKPPPGAADRMIFPKEAARELWAAQFPPPAMFWTPLLDDVMKMERQLPAFLRREGRAGRLHNEKPAPLWKRVAGYKRQYFGLVEKGRSIVYGNFFCADGGDKDWQRRPVDVDDGGDCYFQVRYDPKTGRFFALSVNADA
jgi:hypothetical protein